MSYILEALKKLERERQRERVPDLLTLQGEDNRVTKKRLLWPYIIAGLILLNALFVFWLLWVDPRMNIANQPTNESKLVMKKTTHNPQIVAEERKEQPVDKAKNDVPLGEKKDIKLPVPSQVQKTPSSIKIKQESSSPKTEIIQPPPSIQTKVESSSKTAKPTPLDGKIPSIRELSPDLKASLPEIKMTVHSYNENTQSRFVVINNNILREGQSISNDLKLEHITQNGAILNHRGHRFLLGINENP